MAARSRRVHAGRGCYDAAMTVDATDLLQQAMHLPVKARAKLAAKLIGSLDEEEPDTDVDAAWAVEIDRRLAEVDAGTAKLVPAEEALRRVRAKIRRA